MIFRTYQDEAIYVIAASEGSKFLLVDEEVVELILFETMASGTIIERRLPSSLIVKAALRGVFGLKVVEKRRPAFHPEAAATISRN